MNYKEFINLLKSNKMKSVYLFYGEEYYLIDYLIKMVKDTYVDEKFETLNYTLLEGKDLSFDKLINACETLPFMSEKKVVIINDFPLFKNKNQADVELEDFTDAKDRKRLAKYIEELGSYISLIFVEKLDNIRKNNFLYKTIAKAGGIVELNRLSGMDLNIWVSNQFKEQNKAISKDNIRYFIEQTSYLIRGHDKNLYDLKNEILKISNYVSDGNEISRDSIDSLMAKPLEINIFNLLDSIGQKDGKRAIRLFNEMYLSNEPVLIILHMIARQFRNMLHIKSLRTKGYMEGEVNSKVRLSPYEYKKLLGQSNNFSISQLERALFHCLEADKSIKTSSIDNRLALEVLISNLCFNI